MTTPWTREHLAELDTTGSRLPLLDPEETRPVIENLYLWDLWPICRADGSVPRFDGRELWMALSAPRTVEPSERHGLARLRLLSTSGSEWRDHGMVFPDGASPGSREWAGSAVVEGAVLEGGRLRVRYTAAGVRGEEVPSYVQRMFEASARLETGVLSGWSDHHELVAQDTGHYRSTLGQVSGAPGFIKAFRDPSVFIDPRSRAETLVFSASLPDSATGYDGAVGVATRPDADAPWTVGPPLLHADGVNNEMERPHIVSRDGRYYLFFSTQARTYHPDLRGPTGLYGFVADAIDGEWAPLNGSALVLRNPDAEPYQCYSWLVLADRRVTAFVDMPALSGRDPDQVEAAGEMARYFAGTPAPEVRLELDGATARLAE